MGDQLQVPEPRKEQVWKIRYNLMADLNQKVSAES